jgi:hypothetical protein
MAYLPEECCVGRRGGGGETARPVAGDRIAGVRGRGKLLLEAFGACLDSGIDTFRVPGSARCTTTVHCGDGSST